MIRWQTMPVTGFRVTSSTHTLEGETWFYGFNEAENHLLKLREEFPAGLFELWVEVDA